MQEFTSNYGPTYLSLGFPDSDTLVGIGCGGGFQQECGQHFSPLTCFLKMKGNNMGTWKRRPQLPEHRLLVWRCGLVTTGKRLVVWKRAKSRKPFGRNSPSAPLLWDAKLSILKPMIWGALPCDIWTALRVHSLGKYDNSWKTTPQPSTLQLCRFGMTWLENLHHVCLEKSIALLSPSCGWAYAEKEKDSLACLPPLLLRQQVSLVAKSGVLCCPAADGCHMSPIRQWLECAILSWSHSMGQVGTLVSLSPMRNRCEGASSLSSGMFHVLTRMQLRTLELLLNGWQNVALSMLMPSLTWLSCTIGMTWPICSVPATGSLNPKTPLSPEESPPVLAWQPIQLSLPKPELVSWLEVVKSHFSIYHKMNKRSNWRKRTLVLRWLSPGLGHFAFSWALSIWRASLELLRWWVRSCMVLGMYGLDVFFWTMLRASLQLWQSLGCASIVIVRQRDQKERSGTMKDKASQTPKQQPKHTTRPWPIE